MKLASALPQNSVVFSGGILPPSKSATATVEGETLDAVTGWTEATVSRSVRPGFAAGDSLEELPYAASAALFGEEV
jgi:hypothetical protein